MLEVSMRTSPAVTDTSVPHPYRRVLDRFSGDSMVRAVPCAQLAKSFILDVFEALECLVAVKC